MDYKSFSFVTAIHLLQAVALAATPMRCLSETRAIVFASNYAAVDDQDLHLSNALQDGAKIVEALQRAGLKDVQLIEEATEFQWEQQLKAFIGKLSKSDTALFYYAGHGIQAGGLNYFVTSDGYKLILADQVLKDLSDHAAATIMIVDACRANPYAHEAENRLTVAPTAADKSREIKVIALDEALKKTVGLAQIGNLRGMSAVVYFSTEPGNVAVDGAPGAGSPFANAFAEEVVRRETLDHLFRRVTTRVNQRTDGKQSPWRQGDLPADFFLAGMANFPVP